MEADADAQRIITPPQHSFRYYGEAMKIGLGTSKVGLTLSQLLMASKTLDNSILEPPRDHAMAINGYSSHWSGRMSAKNHILVN